MGDGGGSSGDRKNFENTVQGDFHGGQWLRFQASNARGRGSIPGQGMKITHATQHGKEKKNANQVLTIVKKEGKKGELDMENLSPQLASKV